MHSDMHIGVAMDFVHKAIVADVCKSGAILFDSYVT